MERWRGAIILPERTGIKPNPQKDAEPRRRVDIGPNSLLWKYLGDPRIGTTGMSAGILQLMHPGVGAGVSGHSDFFEDPWGRIIRSLPQIVNVVYSPNGVALGQQIRDYHTNIRGTDGNGRSYHALSPETYWWPHATFHHMVENMANRFEKHPLTPIQTDQLYGETTEWYSRYSVTDRPVPRTYTDFRRKWNGICENVLEMTPAAERLIDMVNHRTAPPFPDMPRWLWKSGAWLPTNEFIRIMAVGGLPEVVRNRFHIPWSKVDQAHLKMIEKGAIGMWQIMQNRYQDRPGDLIRTLGRLDRNLGQSKPYANTA